MAFTLAQLAKLETDPTRKGIMTNIIRDAKVMELLPWENVGSLQSVAVRYRTLPTGGVFRKVGGAYTEATDGDVEQVWESVYGFGGEILFDRVFDKITNTIIDPKVLQTQMKLKAMALQFNDYFINGDHATDADGFEGLKKRVSGMPSRQTIAIGDSAPSDATASAAAARTFLKNWDKAWYRCNNGSVNAIFMNEAMVYAFGDVLRYIGSSGGNLLDVTKDSFDRDLVTYKGAPFIDMGLKADQSTEIITVTETALDAGADSTSVYFASFNIDQGVVGIQLGPLESYDPNAGGEMSTQPAKQLRIEWWHGLAGFGSYGLTRLYNIGDPAGWTA